MTAPDLSQPSPRRLGYVLKRFPRISETFVAAEMIELERQGEDITVFALSRPAEPFTHPFVDELHAPVVYLPHRPSREPLRVARALVNVVRSDTRGWLRAAGTSVWPPRRAGVRRLLQATVLRDELARAGITHVHAHFATAAARLANLSWRMGGPTFSVTAHAKDVWHEEVREDHLVEKLRPATFVATVTEENRTHLRALLGPGANRVHLVPNAVDTSRLATMAEPERGLVVTVARLVEKKGIIDLVAACGLLARRPGLEVRLEVIGDGPLRPELEALARREGVDASFLGALPHDEVVNRMARASVFSLPAVVASTGDRDGLPTAVLEAMAVGVPVVTTAVNGLTDAVVHEKSGLVVPEHDPHALAEAIERLLRDRLLAARLAVTARRHVEERFALPRTVGVLRSLFPGGVEAGMGSRPTPSAAGAT